MTSVKHEPGPAMKQDSRDLTRTVLSLVTLGALIGCSLWILQPFVPAIIWAVMIVVATWPLMLGVQARLGGRRAPAVAVMTLALLFVLVLPLLLAAETLVENAGRITALAKSLSTMSIPPPPEWLQQLPLLGERAAAWWREVAATGREELASSIIPYAGQAVAWLAARAGSAGVIVLDFFLTIVIAAILYASGEEAAARVLRFARRLASERGAAMTILSTQAIRGVALGVVVTALAQAALGWVGLVLTGIPFDALLGVVMFLLAVAQIGALPVLVPAVAWLYWSGDSGWGTFLLVWTVIVASIDNVLRPVLIKRGADLPLLLIFAGVIGGLIAFGLIGLFIGPVVLAVSYTLLEEWISEDEA